MTNKDSDADKTNFDKINRFICALKDKEESVGVALLLKDAANDLANKQKESEEEIEKRDKEIEELKRENRALRNNNGKLQTAINYYTGRAPVSQKPDKGGEPEPIGVRMKKLKQSLEGKFD